MATILVVDDEKLIRDSLVALLGVSGEHQVDTAATPREATLIAESQSPDLLIVDWMLGDEMSGLELIHCLRESIPSLPVILVTGYPSERLRAQLNGLSNSWVLPKPCKFEDLRRTVELALSSHQGADVSVTT